MSTCQLRLDGLPLKVIFNEAGYCILTFPSLIHMKISYMPFYSKLVLIPNFVQAHAPLQMDKIAQTQLNTTSS